MDASNVGDGSQAKKKKKKRARRSRPADFYSRLYKNYLTRQITWDVPNVKSDLEWANDMAEELDPCHSSPYHIPVPTGKIGVSPAKFKITLFYNTDYEDDKYLDYLGIRLTSTSRHYVTVAGYLRNRRGYLVALNLPNRPPSYFFKCGCSTYNQAIKKEVLDEDGMLGEKGTLTIVLDLKIYSEHLPEAPRRREPTLGRDLLRRLPMDGDGGVKLRSGEECVAVHRLVLESRSDVFAAMFRHGSTSESQTGEVRMDDMAPAVLRGFVDFLYTDELGPSTSSEVLSGLLVAADKYNVPLLRKVSRRRLADRLGTANACRIAALAESVNDAPLLEAAIRFMASNLKKVNMSKVSANTTRRVLAAVREEM